jgi:hypothetical protein
LAEPPHARLLPGLDQLPLHAGGDAVQRHQLRGLHLGESPLVVSSTDSCFQASSPACTELEMIVMNWLGKMVGLPEEFLHRKGGSGGGVIQVRGFSGLRTSRGTLLSDHRERVHSDQFAGRALASHQEAQGVASRRRKWRNQRQTGGLLLGSGPLQRGKGGADRFSPHPVRGVRRESVDARPRPPPGHQEGPRARLRSVLGEGVIAVSRFHTNN